MSAQDDELSLKPYVFKAEIEQLAGSQSGKKTECQLSTWKFRLRGLNLLIYASHKEPPPFRFIGDMECSSLNRTVCSTGKTSFERASFMLSASEIDRERNTE
jgi:hypothetical protein